MRRDTKGKTRREIVVRIEKAWNLARERERFRRGEIRRDKDRDLDGERD